MRSQAGVLPSLDQAAAEVPALAHAKRMQATVYNMCYMATRMRTVAVYGNSKAEGGDGGVSHTQT